MIWQFSKTNITKEVYNNYNSYFEENNSEYLNVIPAAEWVQQKFTNRDKASAFLKISLAYLKFFEKILGKRVYIESESPIFLRIEPSIQKLISFLFEKKIVAALYKAQNLPDEPKTTHYYFGLNPIKDLSGKNHVLHGSCGGSGTNSNIALKRACAEALERYSVAVCRKKVIYGSYSELKNKGAVNPIKFLPFSKRQLQTHQAYINRYPLNENTKLGWLEAFSLFNKNKYLVPAQLCYIFYEKRKDEPIIRETSTSGAAAGASLEQATYAAFCEAIERDAILIHHLNKLSPPQINLKTIENPKFRKILGDYKRYNLELCVFDITTDINIPTFLALTIDKTGHGPAVHIATKTDFNIEETLFDIIYDGLRIRPQLRPRINKENFKKINKIYPDIKGVNDRLILWGQTKMIKEIKFLLQGPKKMLPENNFKEIGFSEKLEMLKRALKKAGLEEAYFVDISSEEARENNFWVVMSLTPQLYPLYLDENLKYLGVERLYKVPVKLGYFKKPKSEKELNKIPHPMA